MLKQRKECCDQQQVAETLIISSLSLSSGSLMIYLILHLPLPPDCSSLLCLPIAPLYPSSICRTSHQIPSLTFPASSSADCTSLSIFSICRLLHLFSLSPILHLPFSDSAC
ncbi:hypothetical protein SLEP1_g39537 [Rubroshorea leprosula]|uniref:Uncharacterized protein n=1 Tax=Rubroshorea leprosula TaxID=152421 RepID=A0AAV5L0H7_9ROSI|nr:hypothetical protein SLEP1_g39537 [Rubroshorea leprosula]